MTFSQKKKTGHGKLTCDIEKELVLNFIMFKFRFILSYFIPFLRPRLPKFVVCIYACIVVGQKLEATR